MDERASVLLRRKLEALNYTETLDSASAPLVSHIVNDLIRTTDSYRSVKQQANKYAQEIATFNTKLEVVRQDAGRLSKENSQLHDQLIREGERYKALQRESYTRTKRLEDQVCTHAPCHSVTFFKFSEHLCSSSTAVTAHAHAGRKLLQQQLAATIQAQQLLPVPAAEEALQPQHLRSNSSNCCSIIAFVPSPDDKT
eukprot:GHRQ01021313.1.p2 GENE.GHRQ01021313.1~~GHRQ01021313.1.p2  ORF type:complete len:197 (+),score=49.36 GHRQ01021313.1:1535-2125(+)